MICPWCENEMQFGDILCDGRSKVVFRPEGTKRTFWDYLSGIGDLTAARIRCWASAKIPAHYCDHCGKMVIETKVSK